MASGLNGLVRRKLAPEFMASSLIAADASEVMKPKGTLFCRCPYLHQEVDAGHFRHVPVGKDELRLLCAQLFQSLDSIFCLARR